MIGQLPTLGPIAVSVLGGFAAGLLAAGLIVAHRPGPQHSEPAGVISVTSITAVTVVPVVTLGPATVTVAGPIPAPVTVTAVGPPRARITTTRTAVVTSTSTSTVTKTTTPPPATTPPPSESISGAPSSLRMQ